MLIICHDTCQFAIHQSKSFGVISISSFRVGTFNLAQYKELAFQHAYLGSDSVVRLQHISQVDKFAQRHRLLDRMPFKLMNPHCTNKGSSKRKIAEPMVSELVLHDDGTSAISTKVLSQFQSPCSSLWLALDIKTHDLIPNTTLYQSWFTGQFGHPCFVCENHLEDFRIVQICWSIGYIDACSDPLTKSLLIKPEGFVISEAVATNHGITTEKATVVGSPISRVLIEFLSDFADVQRRFGRVCGHHLEFIMGVIKSEMLRAGLDNELDAWSNAATNGFCTMNPDITDRVCIDHTKHIQDSFSMGQRRAISLKDMALTLLTGYLALMNQCHEVGAASRTTWLVLRELARLSTRAAVLD